MTTYYATTREMNFYYDMRSKTMPVGTVTVQHSESGNLWLPNDVGWYRDWDAGASKWALRRLTPLELLALEGE